MFNNIKERIKNKRMTFEEIDDPKLNEFLSHYSCYSCHNHCRLNNIRCGGGNKARNAKLAEYNAH